MWLFRHKKRKPEPQASGPHCTFCGSFNTKLVTFHGTNQASYVKVWRGQRSLTYHCLDCGLDFYAQEPSEGVNIDSPEDNSLVDDEQALREAEDEIRKQIEQDDDRLCP